MEPPPEFQLTLALTLTWTDGVLQFSYTQPEDLAPIAAMLAKASVCEHVFFGPNAPDETRAYFIPLIEPMQASLKRDEMPEGHVFTIREAKGSEFVGECALLPVMFGEGNYTIGYQLDEPYWRRGYGTRACQFVLWYGFFKLGARRLSGDTLRTNAGSARIMEKCGFKQEGVQNRYYLARGQAHDNVLFGLLREELPFDLDEMTSRFQPMH